MLDSLSANVDLQAPFGPISPYDAALILKKRVGLIDRFEEGRVRLEVFNVVGQRVRTLVAGRLAAGEHRVKWDGRDETGGLVSSGIYFYRLRAGTFEQIRRMALLK